MIVKVPDYYNGFQCIANRCKHTCCASWEVDVDNQSYQYYCSIEGEFGKRLRDGIKKDTTIKIKMHHGKCPFLDENQLCEIYQNLGQEAMCEVCTEYPRFEEEYPGTREEVLALSCEEVARILYTKKDRIKFIESKVEDEDKVGLSSDGKVSWIVAARDCAIDIIQDRTQSLTMRCILFLSFCQKIQEYLDQDQLHSLQQIKKEWDVDQELIKEQFLHVGLSNSSVKDQIHRYHQKRMDILLDMEVMEEEWLEEINNVSRMFYSDSMQPLYEQVSSLFYQAREEYQYEYEHLMVYFAYRYLIEAISDGQFLKKAQFGILGFLTIRDMDRMRFMLHGMEYKMEDRIETSRIYCKQVEHSKKCMDYLANRMSKEEVFSVEALSLQINDVNLSIS